MAIVVVTGAAGFLGSHISESLLGEGSHVIGIDNFCTGQEQNIDLLRQHQNFRFIEGDVCDSEVWKTVRKTIALSQEEQVHHVYHFASPASPPLYQRLSLETMMVNSNGLLECLNFATSVGGRVIYASTSEVYGDPEIHPQLESYWGNVNSYGARACYDEAKRFGEALLYSYNLRHQTQHGLVRIFNTYGPRMNPHDGRVVINFLVQALAGGPLTVYGDGKQTRSFCYVDDLVSGIRKYAESGAIHPMNLGNPGEFTILELAKAVQKLFPQTNFEIVHQDFPADDPRQRRPDISRAQKELQWSPKVSLDDGLGKMLRAMQTQSTNAMKGSK